MATVTNASFNNGVINEWEYTWEEVCEYMNDVGNYSITGALLPTPKSSRTNKKAASRITWHHLAPMVGFRITSSNDVIKIKSIDEEDGYSRNYDYDNFHPKITFYYKNDLGNDVKIASFGGSESGDGGAADYRNGTTKTKTITRVDTSSTYVDIYVDCSATTCHFHDNREFLGRLSVSLHEHIDETSAPSISSSTGKTIRVKNGKDGIQMEGYTEWFDTPHTFTELTNGTYYRFRCREYCEDCTESPAITVYSNYARFRTWNITGRNNLSTTEKLSFTATHVAGSGTVLANDRKISYRLYKQKNISSEQVGSEIISNNSETVVFTGLQPNTKYYCFACTYNHNSSSYMSDNYVWIEATTKNNITYELGTPNASATTLRMSLSWDENNLASVDCNISCDGINRTLTTNGGYVGFTGLTPDTIYGIDWSIVATYTFDYSYNVLNEETNELETKTDTITEIEYINGDTFITTKKATLIIDENTDITSKIIRFKSNSNYLEDIMEQTIIPGYDWEQVEQNTYSIFNNLNHDTIHTISCRIAGCYAFDTSGNQTSVNDSVVSKTVKTKLLSLSGSIIEEHQHSLVTSWQAFVNGIVTNQDAIDNTPFEFSYMDTLAQKNNPPYQAAEVIEGSNGTTIGNYQTDKKVYSNNLTWYYCEYIVTVSITDGYNIVAAAITAHTTFPHTWIFSNGVWHRYMPHIYTNGNYIPAPAFIYKNDKFIEPNGE